jgi:hypothetical protein
VRFPRATATLLLSVLPSGGPIAGEPQALAIAIVVGIGSPIRQVNVDTLRDLYLRRQRLWSNGDRAMPVNLPADDPLRAAFSKRVLGRLPGDLESYWLRLYREGVQPPLVLKTSQAVCAYVAVEHAAIGYVRPDEVDGKSCRVLFVLAPEGG